MILLYADLFILYILVSTVVFGYYRIDKRKRILDAHDVYMDPIIIQSTGLWADAPKNAIAELDRLGIDPMAAIHAACKVFFLTLKK